MQKHYNSITNKIFINTRVTIISGDLSATFLACEEEALSIPSVMQKCKADEKV